MAHQHRWDSYERIQTFLYRGIVSVQLIVNMQEILRPHYKS